MTMRISRRMVVLARYRLPRVRSLATSRCSRMFNPKVVKMSSQPQMVMAK